MGYRVIFNRTAAPKQLGAATSTTKAPFECFWGTPYRDVNGVWRCPESSAGGGAYNPPYDIPPGPPNPDDQPVKPPPEPQPVIQTSKPGKEEEEDLIFGFKQSHVLIAGAVAAGLYFMSQSGGATKP